MANTTYLLEVMTDAGIMRMTFNSRAAANKALKEIEPKIGERFTNDPDKQKHRINGPDGSLVVNIENVRAVKVTDMRTYYDGVSYWRDEEEAAQQRMAEMMAQALKAVGLAPLTIPTKAEV